MRKEDIVAFVESFLDTDEGNRVAADGDFAKELAQTRVYDGALLRVGAADDPLFAALKQPEAIGEEFRPPMEWLPSARSVISIFLPFTKEIRRDNARDMGWPSSGWLYGRYEGQRMINRLTALLVECIQDKGYKAIAPSMDAAFFSKNIQPRGYEAFIHVTTNWSERHAAYICGIGTFGLSKGMISEKGVAGRLTSVVTSLPLPVDERSYAGLYDYCSLCGACARNCPAGAISIEHGKDHLKCSQFLDRTRETCDPRYGCGKCQVKVPCEGRPAKRASL